MSKMYYPIMIDLKDKYICIVGAGNVALRKARKYLEYEAKVVVVGKLIKKEFYTLKNIFGDKLSIIEGDFKSIYLENAFLVEIATNDRELNAKIADICRENSVLCNVVDSPGRGDYIIPSTVKRGSLILSVSTLGKSPSYCSKIRKELEERYDHGVAEFVDLLGEARKLVLDKLPDVQERRSMLKEMAYMTKSELVEAIMKLEER